MTLQNTNNKYSNSQEKSLNEVLNINNPPKPNTEALELFFLYMEDDLAPLEVPFVPRKEQETSKLALNFRTSPKKFKQNNVIVKINPGKISIHGCSSMDSTPYLIKVPQLLMGG